MQFIRYSAPSPQLFSGSVVCVGNFDGVHSGHQALLKRAKSMALTRALPLVVVTFEPHPRTFFSGEPGVRLQRMSEKCMSLAEAGVDALVCVRFNQTMASMTADDFIHTVLQASLAAQVVVVGEDFRFGQGRVGDVRLLQSRSTAAGFVTIPMAAVMVGEARVSSTDVRQQLQAGAMDAVTASLGRPYRLTARVVYGDQRGREWGFPTVNLPLFRETSPLTGIFAVRVVGPDFIAEGVASIGYRPVFRVSRPLLEVFILDFDRDVYGQRLSVDFLHKLREEGDFTSVEALIEQIQLDVVAARDYFSQMRALDAD